jgi:dihydrofolate reductase
VFAIDCMAREMIDSHPICAEVRRCWASPKSGEKWKLKALKTTIYIASTIDGFIARPDGTIDWLEHDSKGQDYGWAAFRQSIDALVLGRQTYEQVLGFGVDWPYRGLATFVWSRTLTNDDIPPTLADDVVEASGLPPAALLDELAGRGLKNVWIDGGQTLQSFLAEGLVDIITVTRLPILIGRGIPLFGHLPSDVHLKHLDTRFFDSGVVQSSYAVRK